MIEADRLFVACPRCAAWPMVANVALSHWPGQRKLSFRCSRCGYQETVSLTGSVRRDSDVVTSSSDRHN